MRIEARQGDATMRGVFGCLYSWRPPVERTERKQNITLQRVLPKSALGQKQTFRSAIAMSALPPKADIRRFSWNVRFGPKGGLMHRSRLCAVRNLFVARCKRCELSWTGPIEWNVLARIGRPLEFEAERID